MATQQILKMCIDKVFRTPDKAVEAGRLAMAENPENAPGRMAAPRFGVRPAALERARIAFVTGKKWSNGRRLRVHFTEGVPAVQDKVRHYAREWMNYANLTFDFVDDPAAEIRIAFQNDGSWSWIGTDALAVPRHEHTMNFGWLTPSTPDDEYSRVVIHEFGHAVGCIHEHQHPQAGIPWDTNAVYRYYMGPPNNWTRADVDNNIFDLVPAAQTQFSAFDPASIMCYAVPNQLTLGDYEIGWNRVLSESDKQFAGVAYPKTPTGITELKLNDGPVDASIGAHGQVDVFMFRAPAAGQYTLETHGFTDVVMTLAGPTDQTQVVDEDDDSGRGRNARIVARLAPGPYYVRVRHYHPTGTGNYRIAAKSG